MLTSLVLTSCKPGEGAGETTTSETVTDELPLTQTKTEFIVKGKTEYKIVRPEVASSTIINTAVNFRERVIEFIPEGLTGIKLTDDFVKRDQVISDTEKVVLIGLTNRKESAQAHKDLGLCSYRVTVINGKLVIAGYTEKALNMAVGDLIKHIKNNITEDGSFTFEENFLIEGTSNETLLSALPMLENSSVSAIHDMGDECQLVIMSDATPEKFDKYKAQLKEKGYEEYAVNTIGDNLFATYKDSKNLVTAYYTKYSGELRVNIEPLSETALATREQDNKYTAVTTPLVTQIGVERKGNSSSYQNGMSYLFRLSDGSFIIYDGGFSNSNIDGKKLNDVMTEQAPDPKNITIAAWVITHAHSDHYGGFIAFNSLYSPNTASSKYKIEMVIRNTPTEADSQGAENKSTSKQVAVEKALKSRGVSLVKSHPGQVFYIRDSKITVIYNLEMFVPSNFTYFNTSTTVTKLELAGQSFMMLGDCSEDGSRIIVKTYNKDFMMCDFVQVAHHGYQGGTTALYSLIDPYYVLWPMATTHYATYKDKSRSEYLISSKKVVDIYTAGYSKFVFQLPFDGKNYTKTDYAS